MKLIKRKEHWTLTWFGWVVLLAVLCLAQMFFLMKLYPFLALTKPVNADILIADGLLSEYALKKLKDEFRSKNYRLIITTGGPLRLGYYLTEYKTESGLTAAFLQSIGIDVEAIVSLPSKQMEKEKTFASALAVKEWLGRNNLQPKGINVFSDGTRGRRSWILFKRAFDDQTPVGILSCEHPHIDPMGWWRTSIGVRGVLDETIAYIYARFFFFP